MEKKVTFFGINFRSESHFGWFKLNMTVLAFSAGLFLVCFFLNRGALYKVGLYYIMESISLFCFSISLLAIVVTRFGTVNDKKGFSIDCIWFNALMSGIYFGMMYLLKN